jgi:hypothetical protein
VYICTQMVQLDPKELDKELKRIYAWFDYKRSRALSVAAIEELAEVPKNTLLNFLKVGRRLPQKHIYKIVSTLEYFGYEPMFDWPSITSKHS